jgi:hypothetical protein
MRYWKMKLSSKELALIMICITESVMVDLCKNDEDLDSLKILKEKIHIANKIFKTLKIRQLDKQIMKTLEVAMKKLENRLKND